MPAKVPVMMPMPGAAISIAGSIVGVHWRPIDVAMTATRPIAPPRIPASVPVSAASSVIRQSLCITHYGLGIINGIRCDGDVGRIGLGRGRQLIECGLRTFHSTLGLGDGRRYRVLVAALSAFHCGIGGEDFGRFAFQGGVMVSGRPQLGRPA